MLPIPEVSDVEMAFPTSAHCPKWEDVPVEFKRGERYENTDHPWCKVASAFALGLKPTTEWQALPKEGVDPEKAWRAVHETLGSYRDRVEIKIASAAYMLSEWFDDCWFKGDTHTAIKGLDLSTLFDEDDA